MLLPIPQIHIPDAVCVHAIESQVRHIEDPDRQHSSYRIGAEPFQGRVPVVPARPGSQCPRAETGVSVSLDRNSGNASGFDDRRGAPGEAARGPCVQVNPQPRAAIAGGSRFFLTCPAARATSPSRLVGS